MQRYTAPMPDRPVQAWRAAKAPHGGTGVVLIGISKFSEERKASRLLRIEKRASGAPSTFR